MVTAQMSLARPCMTPTSAVADKLGDNGSTALSDHGRHDQLAASRRAGEEVR